MIEMAALLHDIKDWKYSGSETAGLDAARAFLMQHKVTSSDIDRILGVISHIGFKNELSQGTSASLRLSSFNPELAVVQDADRYAATS